MAETTSALALGQEALERGSYQEALVHFEHALQQEESAQAYEGLSWAAWWLNDADLLFRAREQAFRLFRQKGNDLGAARIATWLSSEYIDFRGEFSIANGWRQRAHRLLKDQPIAAEHGWLAVVEGDTALSYEDDTQTALRCARQALTVARELAMSDIEVMGLALEGIAMVTEGQIGEGMKRLDEASASALGGELRDPMTISWALCYLIFACERVRDFDRATQWCEKLREYADRFQISAAQGICRVHYAGVLIWRGEWAEAESELSEAAQLMPPSRILTAEATVRWAELRRRQGRLEEAEQLFRQAEWHPMALIGLAELALDAGKPRDARELVARSLRQVPETSRTQRAAAYELAARVEALLGNHARAAEAFAAVRSLSETVATIPLKAATSFSAGALAIGDGDYEQARMHLEDAVGLFERGGAPYESARGRLELASVLVALDRLDRARAEARSAHEALRRLGSVFYAGRAAALLRDIDRRATEKTTGASAGSLLTERQIEILRLISRGLNDREIAGTLVVSEHTVHRHVANILQRLDLPSRAAAVAYAGSHGLI
jgi:DNA-binding CsgD family transcriptional regulator/uncharacterized protein HemY